MSNLGDAARKSQSRNVLDQFMARDEFRSCRRVGIFVSLPMEVSTIDLIQSSLSLGKLLNFHRRDSLSDC